MYSLTTAFRSSKHIVALALWVGFVGWAVWQHAARSDQPPLYDASGYYEKAHNFWNNLHQEKMVNPLNLAPTFRPPGTVLMAYPFGFHADYRGFYFRSIFFPVALLCIAIAIAGFGRGVPDSSRWFLVLFAIYLSSLPAFYYFGLAPDFPLPHYWGMVDFFLSGMAALAAAFSIRSIEKFSLTWVAATALSSAFCVFIKPTGTVVMALIGLIWSGLSLVRILRLKQAPGEQKVAIKWFWRSIFIQSIIGLAALILAFNSAYLSQHNLAFGINAMEVMRNEVSLSWHVVKEVIIHRGLGYPFPMIMLLMVLFIGHRLPRTTIGPDPWSGAMPYALAASSGAVFIFGVWFWIVESGAATQIRYFFPFLLMAAVYAAPIIGRGTQQMSRWQLVLISILMIVPSANLAILLADKGPSPEWQKWTGVNLSSGAGGKVALQANKFVSNVQGGGKNIIVYSFLLDWVDAIFQSAFDYARVVTPEKPTISIRRPVDWARPSTFRTEEMLDADYWIIEPVRDSAVAKSALARFSIDEVYQENLLFEAWATQLTANDGVKVVSETPKVRILRITNATLLETALDKLIASHHWRRVFIEANPKRRLSESELAAALAKTPASLEKVYFSDRFELRALSINKAGSETTLRIWWKPTSPMPERDWAFFIHLIDDKGKILDDYQIPLRFNRSLSSLRGKVLFDQITFRNLPENKSKRIAVGIFRPGNMLIANKGMRDWNNTRVIVPLP